MNDYGSGINDNERPNDGRDYNDWVARQTNDYFSSIIPYMHPLEDAKLFTVGKWDDGLRELNHNF